ncbi:hypothetical protein [Maribellus maritimus]|uniref:hypothetical protein n=1 Tax=Maribellus maritimus TaxID=2870838 RepID=UPI001EEB9FB2|nr:hypothetical protein [Maribellus maritimus]MCG6191279.1 hypothetical protein [Maribellus maritimus]
MKYSTFVIAGLLLVLWGVVVFSIDSPPRLVHLIIPLAGIIILLRILYSKKSSKKIKQNYGNKI